MVLTIAPRICLVGTPDNQTFRPTRNMIINCKSDYVTVFFEISLPEMHKLFLN